MMSTYPTLETPDFEQIDEPGPEQVPHGPNGPIQPYPLTKPSEVI